MKQRNGYLAWARRLLRCYPRAWRARYASEMEWVLQDTPITLWTLFDLFLGALDARLHPDLLPRRITGMVYRIRSSVIVIFCAFVVYGIAWLAVRFVRDPILVWEKAVQMHPELRIALTAVDGAGVVALLAIVIGGIPILYVVLRNALRDRHWKILGLLASPLLAAGVLLIYSLLASRFWTQPAANGTPDAPFTPLALVLQLGFVLLLIATIVGSTAAIAIAVSRSHLSEQLLRLVLVLATVTTLGIVAGLVASITLTILILTEAPQLQGSPGNLEFVLLVMAGATVVAVKALQRGIHAAREQAA